MPKTPRKPTPHTPDSALAKHLEQAELSLISAVELFGRTDKPVRDDIYRKRLTQAQETVTHLYGQELVRIRGPLRAPRRRKAS